MGTSGECVKQTIVVAVCLQVRESNSNGLVCTVKRERDRVIQKHQFTVTSESDRKTERNQVINEGHNPVLLLLVLVKLLW